MPTYWTYAATLMFTGFAVVTMLTTANGYVQTTTEPALRGRVIALYMAILMGGTPIGAPIVGSVADSWVPRLALGVGAVAAAVATLIGLGWLVFSRGMRLARHPQSAWRPVVRFADAPTAAIAAITQAMPVVDDEAAPSPAATATRRSRRRRRRGDGGERPERAERPTCRIERLVPADFSEEVALTTPIPLPLPKSPHRDHATARGVRGPRARPAEPSNSPAK